MLDVLKAILLGIVQGLTEFLPVSSSGHLEIAKYLLGTGFSEEDSLLMSVVLHAATALSTIWVFRKEIGSIFTGLFSRHWNDSKHFSLMILLSMIPAGLAGFFLEDELSRLFDGKVLFVAGMLFITALMLWLSDHARLNQKPIGAGRAALIGIAQAVALLPGVSRSGATISTALLLGVDKQKAAEFSFLMVLPLILGKMGKDMLDGSLEHSAISAVSLTAGFVAAFLAGIFACSWMVKLVRRSRLRYFALYCAVLALFVILAKLAGL